MQRSALNPLIIPEDIVPSFSDWEVLGAFNAGVARYEDEIILLLRVAERPRQTDPAHVIVPLLAADGEDAGERSPITTVKLDKHHPELDFSDPRVIRNRAGKTLYLTSISHLRLARSRDGEHFTVDEHPSVWPEGAAERWGIEDPRITQIDDQYYITYSAVSEKGVAVGLLSTPDFQAFRREGLILAPTNKDVVIFPEKIGGQYYMLHRPVPEGIGEPEMWIASSPDLKCWGNHQFLMGLRDGLWDEQRIGAGCIPIKTAQGWLVLYHGADRSNRYCMGAALLDLEQPQRVIARMREPILVPEAEYERSGFFGGVVFACGAVVKGQEATMYYGVSDDSMASVTFDLASVLDQLQPPD
ncbi:glycoside hydrolase family 130 protein [Paenibacillus cisolokensis]